MNFNATLIGQTISFAVFVWLCMKYIWPPLMAALDERNAHPPWLRQQSHWRAFAPD